MQISNIPKYLYFSYNKIKITFFWVQNYFIVRVMDVDLLFLILVLFHYFYLSYLTLLYIHFLSCHEISYGFILISSLRLIFLLRLIYLFFIIILLLFLSSQIFIGGILLCILGRRKGWIYLVLVAQNSSIRIFRILCFDMYLVYGFRSLDLVGHVFICIILFFMGLLITQKIFMVFMEIHFIFCLK